MVITEQHADYLREQAAITAEVAAAAGIRSAVTVDDLPEWAKSWGDQAVPAIVFPWRSPAGDVVEQVRPDSPAGDQKYLWPKGQTSILNAARPVTDEHDTVLIVEGTKQTWAVLSIAPDNMAVYGIGGCRNWSSDGIPLADMEVVEGKKVVVILDADADSNLDVYTAGIRIASQCALEGASEVRFLRTNAGGSNGIDDVLASRKSEKRSSFFLRMVGAAATKPADAKPKAKKAGARVAIADASTAERHQIFVDGDRFDVINQVTHALLARWNGVRLFNYGEGISLLTTGRRFEQQAPVLRTMIKSRFTDLIQETAVTVRRAAEGVEYCYPETQTVDAVLSRHDRFAALDRVARIPFVRRDGSICQTQGYDEASRTMLVTDEVLAEIQVPHEPTAEDLAWAVKLLTEEWLFDFLRIMPTDADRSNVMALVITPFIRGLVDVVPLAVIDGLQMGVGKNLLADVALAIPATGAALEPMPWSMDDEENRKVITSAFRDGTDVFVFDEAHHLQGAALARALTSATWKDRQLGVSQMLAFPNQVTWVSLGNSVRVEGDITRRVYRIALRPDTANPQDRRASEFRHPDLRAWTTNNRAEIVQAILTIIRAWYAAGQPPAPTETSFGSFERWEHIVGGILHHAGLRDFLGNTQTWRSESSFETSYWTAHVHWLLSTFGSGHVFTCSQSRDAMAKDPHSETPPGLTDVTSEKPQEYNRKLGQAYARMNDRYFDGVRLQRSAEKVHDNKVGWMVIAAHGGETITEGQPDPGFGGSGGNGGDPTPNVTRKNTSLSDAGARDTRNSRAEAGGTHTPVTPRTPETGVSPVFDLDNPGPTKKRVLVPTPPTAHTTTLPRDWFHLFSLDTPGVDPAFCTHCGARKVGDTEMDYFRLCPTCTTGTLRIEESR